MTPDFYITNHGTVWSIEAVSENAQEFADVYFSHVEGWQGTPRKFLVDHRVGQALFQQLDDDGFVLAEPTHTIN